MRLLSLAASLLLLGASPAPQYDIVIPQGHVLDGAGNPWVAADIAIKDGRIARIGTVESAGRKEIDATGLYVSPGFFDMMDQSGEVLLKSGGAENKLSMGVTTLIAGEGGTPVDADKIPAYFAQLERQGIAVNFGTCYSPAQARVKVMGDGAGRSTAPQLDAMRREVAAAMKAGAFAVSSALIYPPESFQSTDDLIAMASESGKCGGFYATHMRDESAKILSAIDEATRIGEEGHKVEIFHLKAAFQPLAGKLMPQVRARIQAARDRVASTKVRHNEPLDSPLYYRASGERRFAFTIGNWGALLIGPMRSFVPFLESARQFAVMQWRSRP